MTLLSPEIVMAILDGRQPANLTLQITTKPISLDWERQKSELRFSTA